MPPELEIDDASLTDLEKAMRDRWGTGVALPVSETAPDELNPVEETPEPEVNEPEVEEEEDNEEGEEETPEEEPESTPEVPESPSDLINVGGGRYLPRAQLESYLAFEERLRSDPKLMEHLQAYGRPVEPPKPVVPPEVDLDDPNIRYLYEQNQALQDQLKNIGAGVQAQQAQTLADRESQIRALANRAVSSFKAQHSLNDEEINEVRGVASRINAVNSYMAGVHPITGQKVDPDVLAAMDCALEIAYNSMPQFMTKRHEQEVQRQLDNKNRKKKLAKVGANSGSVPRTPPPAANPAERHKQFVEEVRGMMFGGSES